MKTINAIAFLRLTLWCAAVASCVLPLGRAHAAQFIPLGGSTSAYGVSGDGSFAVGTGNGDALRWTSSGQVLNLGDLPGTSSSEAMAASLTGSVVVGASDVCTQCYLNEAFRWTESSGMQGLGRLPGDNLSNAVDVSADGSIVIGFSADEGSYEAFRWTEGTGMVGLGTLPGDTVSEATGVSADGLVIVGSSYSENPESVEVFRWTEGGGMHGLGALPGDPFSHAWGISADGSTVVGDSGHLTTSGTVVEYEAIRWTASTGMVGLGHLPGHQSSFATGVSGDGSVIVGYSYGGGYEEAFIWDETNGMRRLQDVLTAAGLDLTGWRLDAARGMSDDGNVIAGVGTNPSGQTLGWIARFNTVLGDPDFNNDGRLNCTDIDALVAQIAAGTNGSLFDLTGDGLVDIADLDQWRVQGGAANLPSGNPYLPGDANLDGFVDVSDFNIWNSHRLSQTPAWCAGDFNADGFVDASDWNVWNSHRLMSSGDTVVVPEPASLWLSFVALGWLMAHRRLW